MATKAKPNPSKKSAPLPKNRKAIVKKERPVILITNDDGVTATGINNLV